ncbi:MAG: hypothetical protein RIT81_32040 [Deltaproteobacteria bacterium]
MYRWSLALLAVLVGCEGAERENVNEEIAARDIVFDLTAQEIRTIVGQPRVLNNTLRNTGSSAIALEVELRPRAGAPTLPSGLDVATFSQSSRVEFEILAITTDEGLPLEANERDLMPSGTGTFFLVRPGASVQTSYELIPTGPLPESQYVLEYRVADAGAVAEVPVTITIADRTSDLPELEATPEAIELSAEIGGRDIRTIRLAPPRTSTRSPSLLELRWVLEGTPRPPNITLASDADPDPQMLRATDFVETNIETDIDTEPGTGGVTVDLQDGCPCEFLVDFRPQEEVRAVGRIEIRDGAGNLLDTVRVDLRSPPDTSSGLVADPMMVAFGEVERGEARRRALLLTNTSTSPLAPHTRVIRDDGSTFDGFGVNVDPPSPINLGAGESANLDLTLSWTGMDEIPVGELTRGILIFFDPARSRDLLEVPFTFTVTMGMVTPTPAQVVVGPTHSCLRRDNGEVLCWGPNQEGELGIGTRAPSREPIAVRNLGPVTDLAVGRNFTCAIRETNRDVVCWGANLGGQSGVPGDDRYLAPIPVTLPNAARDISAGDDHACAVLDPDGEVYCWGTQLNGALGNDSVASPGMSPSPIPVTRADGSNLTGATGVDAGPDVTCALLDDMGRRVECWGDGWYGAAGTRPNPSTMDDPQPLGGDATLFTDVIDIAIERRHGCVRRGAISGDVWCFGENIQGAVGIAGGQGQLGLTQVSLPEPAASISVGRDFSCAAFVRGAPRCWGANFYQGGGGLAGGGGQLGANLSRDAPFPPSTVVEFTTGQTLGGATAIVPQISSAQNSSCALATDGRLWCWGGATHLGDLQMPGVDGRGYDRYAAVPVQGAYRTLDEELGYCANGLDDDGDSLADYDDPDCADTVGLPSPLQSTARGFGNDAPTVCGFPGPWRDTVLRWIAPTAARYEVRVEFNDFFIAVSDTPDLSNEVGCKSTNDPLLFDATADGQVFYILLTNDGRSGIDDYTIEVCEGACP